jgi:dihydrofolate synthase/folylpolyglutamate synthase
MAEVFWPARFQVTGGDPAVVIDGTHNPHGAAALAETIRERCGDRGVVFVFGALGEKDFGGVIAKLAPLAAGAVVTRPDSSRAADPEKVAAEWKREGIQAVVNGEPAAALHVARGLAGPLGVPVVVCGSLYLVGSYLEPGWKL